MISMVSGLKGQRLRILTLNIRCMVICSLQSSHPSQTFFLTPSSLFLPVRKVGGKRSHFPFTYLYLYLYLKSSWFPQDIKYPKTEGMERLKHFLSLKLILFWLLLWSLCFCFGTSLLEMRKTVKPTC